MRRDAEEELYYGPGNPDYEYDCLRQRQDEDNDLSKENAMTTEVADKPKSDLIVETGPYSKRDEAAVPTTQPTNLMQALALAAADPRMDVDKVERLFAMHKELQDREAAQAFADAMARAQSNIVPIAKDRRNDHTKSMYATLAAITDEVTPIVTAEGLAVSYDTFNPERDKDLPALEKGWVRVIAIVSHRGGHRQRHHLDAPLDNAGKDGTVNKTGIQAVGSTTTYLRRYLFCMIFNVATSDDKDGNDEGGTRMDESKLADHLAAIETADDEVSLLKLFGAAWNQAEDVKDKSAQQRLIQHRDARRKVLRAKKP